MLAIRFAFLWIIPTVAASAQSMREQAVWYRVQGYEAQQRGDAENALFFYQKAAAVDPTYATPHNDAGIILEEQGRWQEAEEAYFNALARQPDYAEAHANLAMFYERQGNRHRAIEHWKYRYQLGRPDDPWTARAEERLRALGVSSGQSTEPYGYMVPDGHGGYGQGVPSPGSKNSAPSRKSTTSREFSSHAKSVEEFQAITERHGNWP